MKTIGFFRNFLTAVFFLCTAFSTHADWQYTKWGMTPEEVIAAAQKAGEEPPKWITDEAEKNNYHALLKGAYHSGKYVFTAYFHFNDDTKRFESFTLYLQDIEIGFSLFHDMVKLYGKPYTVDRTLASVGWIITKWHTTSDEIAYVDILTSNKGVRLHYAPRVTADNAGL
jgi:hypothetical protein